MELMETIQYRWPTNLKKFSITDPFLKILTSKYEKEIPWQTKVLDKESLQLFIRDEMLPRLLQRVEYPQVVGRKSYFVSPHHVNVKRFLANAEEAVETVVMDIYDSITRGSWWPENKYAKEVLKSIESM